MLGSRRNVLRLLGIVVMFASVCWLVPARVSALAQVHLKASQKPLSSQAALAPGVVNYVPYHYGEHLICSECHIMHASQQHNYAGNTGQEGGISAFPYQGSANRELLRAADPVQLCLTCHNGQAGIPDVIGPDTNGLAERSAGQFESPNVPNYRGHNLGTGLSSDPNDLCNRCHFGGDFATAAVSCIDCHNPHGNGNPRNLQWASWPGGEPTFGLLTKDGVTGVGKYERANVAYGTQNSDAMREVSNMCLDCHHVFSGTDYIDANGDGIHERHPTYDSERLSPNNIAQGGDEGTSNPDHWVNGVGSGFEGAARVPFVVDGALDFASATVVNAQTNGVFCLSCHKAHGSDSPFSLTWQYDASAGARGCDQCHAIAEP